MVNHSLRRVLVVEIKFNSSFERCSNDFLFLRLSFRYKQYVSNSNHQGQSISMNFWFHHMHDHNPKECDIPDSEATLDKFNYSDINEDEAQLIAGKLSARVGNNNDTHEADKYIKHSIL